MGEPGSESTRRANSRTCDSLPLDDLGPAQDAAKKVATQPEPPAPSPKTKSRSSTKVGSKAASKSDVRGRVKGRTQVAERQPSEGGADDAAENYSESVFSTSARALWRDRTFVLSVLLLLATIWLGWTANEVVRAQTQVTETIGREQNETTLLQGFIMANQVAGLETEREQRMLMMSIALYQKLATNRRYANLSASIPVPTDPQLREILKGKNESDRNAILQLYGRAADIDPVPPRGTGIFHIAIATFQSPSNAIELAKNLAQVLRPKSRRPTYVIRNQRGLYLVLTGTFDTAEEASRNVQELGLAKQFQGVYVTQWRNWTEVCGSAGGGLPCAADER